jgi:hypothetical protein
MVVESFACPVCAEQIAPGRLSCPQCGTVLAAVARSWRSEPVPVDPAPAFAPSSAPSWLDAAAAPAPGIEAATAPWSGRSDVGWDADPALDDPLEPATTPMPTPVATLLDAASDEWRSSPEPEWTDDAGRDEAGASLELDAALDADADAEVDADADAEPPAAAVAAPGPALLAPSDTPEPRSAPSLLRPASTRPNPFLADTSIPDVLQPVEQSTTESALPMTPAAYVPPSAPAPVEPAATEDVPARILPRAWDPAGAAAHHGTAVAPSVGALSQLRARLPLPVIDRARIDEAAGVIVLAGAMASLIGFLLPWSTVVIGSRGTGTYFDTWGLAGQGHLVVFLAVLGALALAAIPNRLDTWLRTGVVGIALGALLLGLAWPYAFGPLGTGVGIVLLVVAACLLLLGGLLSTLVQRHGATTPAV